MIAVGQQFKEHAITMMAVNVGLVVTSQIAAVIRLILVIMDHHHQLWHATVEAVRRCVLAENKYMNIDRMISLVSKKNVITVSKG